MWNRMMMIVGAICVAIAFYIVTRIRRFSFVRSFAGSHPALSWILPSLAVVAVALIFLFVFNVTTMAVVLLHLMIGFLLTDLVFLFLPKGDSRDLQCAIGLAVTVIYLGIGWFNAWHVYRTDYTIVTDKALPKENIRLVEIADSHLGITLNARNFQKQIDRIQAENPDLVVIVGDYVDDDSSKEDMIACCEALGTLDTTYGVYFVYGNHDDGYFNYRNFTSQELRDSLTANGVTILEDEALLLGSDSALAAADGERFDIGGFYLIGRRDRSMRGRSSAEALTVELPEDRYRIMLDHQPNDYAAETAAGADLVLSGHTHGGHIFPAGFIGLWMKANDRVYGWEKRENTNFIVTSGISGWAIPFKTGTTSEYVVVDIHH